MKEAGSQYITIKNIKRKTKRHLKDIKKTSKDIKKTPERYQKDIERISKSSYNHKVRIFYYRFYSYTNEIKFITPRVYFIALHGWGYIICCIFWPAFGCCACQMLVEIVIFSVFAAKNFKKVKFSSHFTFHWASKNACLHFILNYDSGRLSQTFCVVESNDFCLKDIIALLQHVTCHKNWLRIRMTDTQLLKISDYLTILCPTIIC